MPHLEPNFPPCQALPTTSCDHPSAIHVATRFIPIGSYHPNFSYHMKITCFSLTGAPRGKVMQSLGTTGLGVISQSGMSLISITRMRADADDLATVQKIKFCPQSGHWWYLIWVHWLWHWMELVVSGQAWKFLQCLSNSHLIAVCFFF